MEVGSYFQLVNCVAKDFFPRKTVPALESGVDVHEPPFFHAILDRIEQGDAASLGSELPRLNDALNNLRLLRPEYERSLKEYDELQNRKVG